MLRVTALRKTFSTPQGRVAAVDGVSFEIQGGEFYSLLGPSGCGKTTTLRLIAGLERPSSGEIRIGETVPPRRLPSRPRLCYFFDFMVGGSGITIANPDAAASPLTHAAILEAHHPRAADATT